MLRLSPGSQPRRTLRYDRSALHPVVRNTLAPEGMEVGRLRPTSIPTTTNSDVCKPIRLRGNSFQTKVSRLRNKLQYYLVRNRSVESGTEGGLCVADIEGVCVSIGARSVPAARSLTASVISSKNRNEPR